MPIPRYVTRHAPDVEGNITEAGRQDSQVLGQEFRRRGLATDLIATSTISRARQTARAMGARDLVQYPELSETLHHLPDGEIFRMLRAGQIPMIAEYAARRILEDPPTEEIIVTHGLVIVGLTAELVARGELEFNGASLMPHNLEVREMYF